MATAGWLLLGIAASLLALLAIPVELAFSVQRRDGRQAGDFKLGWLFGLVQVPLRPPARPAPKRRSRKAARRRRDRKRRLVAALGSRGVASQVLGLVKTLLRRIQVRTLTLDARIGLDDPADTGQLWALVGPIGSMLPLPQAARVAITPDFANTVFEIVARGRFRIVPIQWVGAILFFALSPTTLRALGALRSPTR